MKLFGQLVSTLVNVATLPLDIAEDIVTLGGVATGQAKPYTLQKLDKIKEEAKEE